MRSVLQTTGQAPCENGEPAICEDMSVAPPLEAGGCGDKSVARCADGTVITAPTTETGDSPTQSQDTPNVSTYVVSFTAMFTDLDFPTLDQETFGVAFKADLAVQHDGVTEDDVHVVAIRAGMLD